MLTKLEIQNYKSICNASIKLPPFTLLIGANGTGKSNLIGLLKELGNEGVKGIQSKGIYRKLNSHVFQKHFRFPSEPQHIRVENSFGQECVIDDLQVTEKDTVLRQVHSPLPEFSNIKVFCIDPSHPGKSEALVSKPTVNEDGSGVVQVLDSLKTGDREDLFSTIEQRIGEYIPEIEKLSFIPGQATKKLQVREKHIPTPVPVEVLSEGTKLVLTILTILYQEHPPSLICIEDIDRGLHPRLFQQIIELCQDLSEKLGIQIIATTHNPYILDQFVGNESAVVIVEKVEGCTTFTTLADRLAQLEENGGDNEMPLGSLWYSGLVGGVPRR